MLLKDRVRIARRFLRSVRIDTDLGNDSALEGFICPKSSADVLMTMARHVSETGQGAFTWTGPYGSGKSSLVVALSALLKGSVALREQARDVFGQNLSNTVAEALPTGKYGWRVVPVIGVRDDPVRVIGEAVLRERLVSRRPRGGWTEKNLMKSLTNAADYKPGMYGGVVLFVDEMGKFLEAAVRNGSDIYIFQQLAEVASRSNGRLLIIGVLHQAFGTYAHRLSHEIRDEWSKVQGRFVDLAINAAGEEQIDLISRAIEGDYRPETLNKLCAGVAAVVYRNNTHNAGCLTSILEACWPLHPVVACLLGPISRRRFGQNQRSIFGFLNSSELYGFQDFLKHAKEDELYRPDRLWDYLRANLEPSILTSPDGHRWALAAEALERCESMGGEELHVKLLKTIAVMDLFKERSGLVANFELLKTCFPEISSDELQTALSQLDKWSFTIFKKFLEAHSIFAGSDFDIDQATRSALEETGEIDFKALESLASIQPIVAKRHYHETGTFRWFDVNIVPTNALIDAVKRFKPANGVPGQFLLTIPTAGESEEKVTELCGEVVKYNGFRDSMVGISKASWAIIPLARELSALEWVSDGYPELAGDSVARREVSARLADVQSLLEIELHKALDNALWFGKNHTAKPLRQADLNNIASRLADSRFNQCPRLHNELLNRQKPSGSAIAARNILLRQMVLRAGEPRLGVTGFPAEGGLFASILEWPGLYKQSKKGWQFVSPEMDSDPCRLFPLWEAALEFVKEKASQTIAVSDIFDLWRKPPFGVKDGLMPILVVAFILSQRDRLAIYREGVFKARFDDVDVDYLAKDAGSIQLRWMDLTDISSRLLSDMAAIVRDFDKTNQLVDLEPIDVARGLVAIYEQLSPWTKRTMRLSTNAVRIREMFNRARDPNKFLFDDIPDTLGENIAVINENDLRIIVRNVREGLAELAHAYPAMLHRLRDTMLAELQVPNTSPQSLAELRDRAENIREVTGDFKLEAFISRLSQFDDSDTCFEGIASLAASKPPRHWIDPDLDQTTIEIADLAQKFLRTEAYARVKGRSDKRHAMAVVVGMDGRPTPVHDEFTITAPERMGVETLIEKVDAALNNSGEKRRNVILAALAELSAHYLNEAAATHSIKSGSKERKVS